MRECGAQRRRRTTTARAKRHHYVPQFHLRLFTGPLESGYVWRYDKQLERLMRLSTKNTAVIGNYYTVQTKDGPDDGLERIFAKVEAAAAPIIRRLCGEEGPTFEMDAIDKLSLSMYLGLQHGRVPVSRDAAQQVAEYVKAAEFDMRLANTDGFLVEARDAGWKGTDHEIDAQREAILRLLRAGEFHVRADESVSLDAPIIGMRDAAPYIAVMGWWLVKRRTFPFYSIGDAPIAVQAARDHPRFLGVGFATADAETAVPLDPNTMLVMRHDISDGLVLREEELRSPSLAAWPWPYHHRQWASAQRYVFGRSQADLAAIAHAIGPEHGRRRGGGVHIAGGPPEWEGYKPT